MQTYGLGRLLEEHQTKFYGIVNGLVAAFYSGTDHHEQAQIG